MKEWLIPAAGIVSILIFIYYVLVVISYWAVIVNAFFKLKTNMKVVNANIDFESESLGRISILVPAYNEADTILNSVQSLLQQEYGEYEIIVINDGSQDDTLDNLIRHFDLKMIPIHYQHQLECKTIKGVYMDLKRPGRLIVVDKENGGKADSLTGTDGCATRRTACNSPVNPGTLPSGIPEIAVIY